MSEPTHRLIHSSTLFDALVEADVVRDGESIRRIVIDAEARNAVKIYVERWGDERLLQVAPTLDGIEISSTPAPPPTDVKIDMQSDDNPPQPPRPKS
jgi:hypothetical protein